MKVINFRLKRKPSRQQVINWAVANNIIFPNLSESNPVTENIFHGWRFIYGTDGVVYLANCIDLGITKDEIYPAKAMP